LHTIAALLNNGRVVVVYCRLQSRCGLQTPARILELEKATDIQREVWCQGRTSPRSTCLLMKKNKTPFICLCVYPA